MDDFFSAMTSRVSMALGDEAVARISRARIIVFGVGGVGSWCAEGLLRSGVLHLTLVDPDIVCSTNLNRQAQAASSTLGRPKVEALRDRFLDINPGACVVARRETFTEATLGDFSLSDYDYVVDAIDSIEDKALLLRESVKQGVKVFSSMGAAGRTDPSRIKTGLLSKTHGCPLARVIRRRLRREESPVEVLCVYSDEEAVGASVEMDREGHQAGDAVSPGGRKRVSGSLAHITALFGFTLTGLVINDIAGKI